jgi:hypothetical protein
VFFHALPVHQILFHKEDQSPRKSFGKKEQKTGTVHQILELQ